MYALDEEVGTVRATQPEHHQLGQKMKTSSGHVEFTTALNVTWSPSLKRLWKPVAVRALLVHTSAQLSVVGPSNVAYGNERQPGACGGRAGGEGGGEGQGVRQSCASENATSQVTATAELNTSNLSHW